jgi:hypothetical protein
VANARKTWVEKRTGKVSVMERILIFIKHHFKFLWKVIEWSNDNLFSCTHKSAMEKILPEVIGEFSKPPFSYRRLKKSDCEMLYAMIRSQKITDLEYFNPHGFDLISIKNQFRKSAFLMLGAFEGEKIAGYFFLRFFTNKKCFVGRLIDTYYRGQGMGNVMNNIMYETAWRMGFRCLSTISRNNNAIMKAHAKNPTMVVLKELQNDYLLVEFVKDKITSR